MKFNRVHHRFKVYHLDYFQVYFQGKPYKMVDISKGGFSLLGDLRELSDDKIFRRMSMVIGSFDYEVTAEYVYFGANITSFKFKSFEKNEKSDFIKFLKYMDLGYNESAHNKKPRILISEDSWSIKTPKVAVNCNPDGFKFLKKPFFKTKNFALYCVLGFISGLSRKEYPFKELSKAVINGLE